MPDQWLDDVIDTPEFKRAYAREVTMDQAIEKASEKLARRLKDDGAWLDDIVLDGPSIRDAVKAGISREELVEQVCEDLNALMDAPTSTDPKWCRRN